MHPYIAESVIQQRVSALHAEAADRFLARSAEAVRPAGSRWRLTSVLRLRRQATAPRVACQG